MNHEELCECTFTEEEIRNSVGFPDDEIENALKSVYDVRQKYIKNLTAEDRHKFELWLKDYKKNRHLKPVTDLQVDE